MMTSPLSAAIAPAFVEEQRTPDGYYNRAYIIGVDTPRGVELLTKAAEGGLSYAQSDLSDAYYNGWGTAEDLEKSFGS